jgi:MYXO-CTERM domain-containing protein
VTAQWDREWAADNSTDSQIRAAMVFAVTAISEPQTALLVALGLGGLAARRQRT